MLNQIHEWESQTSSRYPVEGTEDIYCSAIFWMKGIILERWPIKTQFVFSKVKLTKEIASMAYYLLGDACKYKDDTNGICIATQFYVNIINKRWSVNELSL